MTIFLFRYLKADTVVSFNPWGHGEENPDHWKTGHAVEEAAWMAGVETDYHEHAEAGIQPHEVLMTGKGLGLDRCLALLQEF